jgi:hypothetical protein
MRIASGLFAGIFAIGAIVQLNDPDPLLWILGYAVASVLSIAGALGRPHRVANALAAIVFGLWFLSLATSLAGAPQEAFTSFEMQADSHEEPREAVGLLLLCGWSAAMAVWAGRRSDEETN